MSDLIERLKAWAENYSANRYPAELMVEAATELERLARDYNEGRDTADRVISGLNRQLTEQFALSSKYVAKATAAEALLQELAQAVADRWNAAADAPTGEQIADLANRALAGAETKAGTE